MAITKSLDIAIAGCGPAGLAAALLLQRDGHRVTIFERFETPQPLGSGLIIQPTGLAVLRQLGLDQQLIALAAPIHRLYGRNADSNRVVLDVSYAPLGEGLCGFGVHRAALFNVLYQAVQKAAIPVQTGRNIASAQRQPSGGNTLIFEDQTTDGPYDLIIDALGTRSPLAKTNVEPLNYGALWASLPWNDAFGFDANALEQRYRKASIMAGVLPIGRFEPAGERLTAFFWSLKLADLENWKSRGLAAWKRDVAQIWPQTQPHLDQITTPEQLTVARYYHRTFPEPVQPGLIHIGDSWHSASPQLGQGANMALLDAYALATALRGSTDLASALANAHALRKNHVLLYQLMSALFTPFYQSDSSILPFIRDRLVGPLSRLGPVSKLLSLMVSGLFGKPLSKLDL